jgi:hypothetical protein
MPWNDLAGNQMVSYTDAQTSGATLKSGQSQVTSNQCMTRLDIVTKYNVNINILLCANNQLAPKSIWEIISGFSATMTVGRDTVFYGYYLNLFGSMSNRDVSSVAGSNALIHSLYYHTQTGDLIFTISNGSSITPPSGWTTLGINSNNYNRSSFTYQGYISSVQGWRWILSTGNPIGTTIGATRAITLI